MLTRVWEIQTRGVLHVHPVLAYGTAAEMAAATTYRDALDRFAPQYGFGFVSRKFRPQPARAAAAYLSSYFCTGKKAKLALHESVFSRAMPRSIVHVSNQLTQATGCTMRELRFRRFVWARYASHIKAGHVALARQLAELERELRRELDGSEIIAIRAWHRSQEDDT